MMFGASVVSMALMAGLCYANSDRRSDRDFQSGFKDWKQRGHAKKWLLFPENIGSHLSIDETSLSRGELYTILTNKAAKGGRGSIVAIVAGTKAESDRRSDSH